jgi:hypothetical protein
MGGHKVLTVLPAMEKLFLEEYAHLAEAEAEAGIEDWIGRIAAE